MRNLSFIFLVSFLFVSKSNAQFSENNLIYGNAGISAGNYFGIDIGVNNIRNEKLYLGINYSYRSDDAKNEPEDYSEGFFGSSSVNNSHHSFIASAGYFMPLNTKKTIRLILKGGAGLRWSSLATNYQTHYSGSGWFSNKYYSYDRENKYTPELLINPSLEFAFARGYGLSVSPILSIASGKTFFGASLNNIFGLVRGRTKAKEIPTEND